MSSSTPPPFEHSLMRAWLRRGPLAWLLYPLSLLFRLLAGARRAAYRLGVLRAVRLPVPVVVVGNIFIGGTGKTPLTIWLVQALREAGLRPGVVSRGYGAGEGGARAVHAGATAAEVGDEPLLIAQRTGCPVWVGRKRADAGRALLAAHPEVDVLVCDDGLQHYALARDVEIVLFDGRGVGNGWTLPAGPLREAAGRARDFTVLNVGGDADAPVPPGLGAAQVFRMRLAGTQARRLATGEVAELSSFAQRGGRMLACAGIGNPGRFFALLAACGLRVETLALPDHYDFAGHSFAGSDAEFIFVTEKDAVKCALIPGLADDPRLWVVPVAAQLDGPLAALILEKLRGCTLT